MCLLTYLWNGCFRKYIKSCFLRLLKSIVVMKLPIGLLGSTSTTFSVISDLITLGSVFTGVADDFFRTSISVLTERLCFSGLRSSLSTVFSSESSSSSFFIGSSSLLSPLSASFSSSSEWSFFESS